MAVAAQPAVQYSQGRSSKWSGAKLINCFAERSDGDKREEFAVMAIPGLVSFASLGGSFRGMHYFGGDLYAVAGGTLYRVSIIGVATSLGAIGGVGPVRMADNGTQLSIASADGVGYVLSGGVISTPVPFDVFDVAYADGYMIWVIKDSEQFIISALGDALTYDPTDIGSVEGFPDNIVGVINDHREVQFYGSNSTEIFYNSGNASFPFERQGNAFIERGCLDRDSICKADNSVFFVGNDRIVYRLNGYQPVRISTHAIELFIAATLFAEAFTYEQEGHKFYCLLTNEGTFVYDIATGLWHERRSDGLANWRVLRSVVAYNKTLLGTYDGDILEPDLDVFDEDGEVITVDIYLPTISSGRDRLSMYSFEVLCETGVGNGDIASPTVELRYSDDGGKTFKGPLSRALGAAAAYTTRVIWRTLGRFRERQMWLRFPNPCRRMVLSYWVDAR